MATATPPISKGMTILCVDVEDANIEIESGEIYVVQRTLDGGKTFEFSCRRAHIFRDRIELRPDVTDISAETVVIPRDPPEPGPFAALIPEQTKIIGWVYGAFHSYERARKSFPL
jgi:hypothetical protein